MTNLARIEVRREQINLFADMIGCDGSVIRVPLFDLNISLTGSLDDESVFRVSSSFVRTP
jgi:hypothetical protein